VGRWRIDINNFSKEMAMMNFRISIFIAILLIVIMVEGMVSAISCEAKPDFMVYGFGLNPYRDGQGPGSDIEPNQVREMLETIAPYTRWIRSYSSTHGLQEMAKEANDLGLDVAMGIWVRHEISREAEINNMIDKATRGCVDIVVVGNEDLYAYEKGKSDAIDPCTVRAILEEVHSRLDANGLSNIPVTIAEPWDTLFRRNPDSSFKYQEVLDELDVFMVNIYPYHRGIDVKDSVADLDAIYLQVVADANEAGPNKPVIIGETGWPSEGEIKGAAKPSLKNAARYFYSVQCWAARNDVNVFYFSAYDEEWKSPPESEAHWGVWESDGTIKSTFLPSVTFCEDFDPQINPYCPETRESDNAPEPNVFGGDPNADGNFLRLQYDSNMSHYSAATFDRQARGPYNKIVAAFDFRMWGVGTNGDGFSCLLIPTLSNGPTGCATHGHSWFYADEPSLEDTLGIGFDTYEWHPGGPSGPCDRVFVSWDEEWYPDGNAIDVQPLGLDIDNGHWNRARIEICCADGNTALVNVSITPNIYDINHPDSITIAENVVVGNTNHPYRPYESRIEFAGRNGGLTMNVDIDNIYVSYSAEFCGYKLEGDIDENCRVDLFDFAIIAQNWLIDCRLTPGNPACVAK
jgi:glucan 1,3-beta-glucosidase